MHSRVLILAMTIFIGGHCLAQGTSSAEAPRSEDNKQIDEIDRLKSDNAEDVTAVDSTVEAVEIDEDTPVSHEAIAGEKNLTSHRPWREPNYSAQENALGYGEDAFRIPKGLETAVNFWMNIYSKYTTDQGVLHDAENIDLIYREIDFTPISTRPDLNIYQKEALKIKLVKQEKRNVIAMLLKFSKLKNPQGLSDDEKRVWDYFSNIKEKNKFVEATKKARLRFQLGQRDRMIQGIYFSGRYLEDFEKIFKDAGLPIELTRLPFVESSFNVLARSKVGASGLWQIMPYTMKAFAKRNPAIDLRNHPIEATKVSAKVLKISYNLLKDWPLAVTGYNHGPSGILKLTKKYKTRDLGQLVQNLAIKKRFGFASRNFYASFLAALTVEKNAPKFLGLVSWSQPLDAAEVKIPFQVKYADVLRWFDKDDLKAQVFNPHITSIGRLHRMSLPKGTSIYVMRSRLNQVQSELASPEAYKKALAQDKGSLPEHAQLESIEYRVLRGDTVDQLAKDYGVKVNDIWKRNKIKPGRKLRVGQVIIIP